MAEYTKNYNLKKPGAGDFVSVDDLNGNFDALDGEIKRIDEEVESVNSQLSEIENEVQECFQYANSGKENIKAAIGKKDSKVSIPTEATFQQLADCIGQIKTGVDTSDATVTADKILSGYTAYAKGVKVTGNMESKPPYTTAKSVGWDSDQIYVRIPYGAYLEPTSVGYPELTFKQKEVEANLISSNIVSGKTIFGIVGNAQIKNYAEGVFYVSGINDGAFNLSFTPKIVIFYCTYAKNEITIIGNIYGKSVTRFESYDCNWNPSGDFTYISGSKVFWHTNSIGGQQVFWMAFS